MFFSRKGKKEFPTIALRTAFSIAGQNCPPHTFSNQRAITFFSGDFRGKVFSAKKSETAFAVAAEFFWGGPKTGVFWQFHLLSLELLQRMRRIRLFNHVGDDLESEILIEVNQM
ncbi:MAG: hypothetical protein ACK5W1_11370, partial [Flavobacteriales bacterium]